MAEVDHLEQLSGARSSPPAARCRRLASGTAMFSSAVKLGTRLKAWNTMPTVCRRYSVSADRDRPVTSMSPKRIEPLVGFRIPPRHDSSVVFPHPDGPSRMVSDPGVTSRSEPVDGAHLVVAARRVLDDEVLDLQVGHRTYLIRTPVPGRLARPGERRRGSR